MGRPTLMRHRKFVRLARLVGSRPLARGILEILWDAAYEAGDEELGRADDVEFAADWRGEPGQLAVALQDSGFVDVDEKGVFRVHDLWDHAPEYVKKRKNREDSRRDKRRPVTAKRRSVSGQCPPNGGQRPPNGHPPTPTPAPTPTPKTTGDAAVEAVVLAWEQTWLEFHGKTNAYKLVGADRKLIRKTLDEGVELPPAEVVRKARAALADGYWKGKPPFAVFLKHWARWGVGDVADPAAVAFPSATRGPSGPERDEPIPGGF